MGGDRLLQIGLMLLFVFLAALGWTWLLTSTAFAR